jgi:hypothetical protein
MKVAILPKSPIVFFFIHAQSKIQLSKNNTPDDTVVIWRSFSKSGFMLAVSRDTLPSTCKRRYLPSPAGVQPLRAATRSLPTHLYYTQIRSKNQPAIETFFLNFFANTHMLHRR